jgi:hypothetical protein
MRKATNPPTSTSATTLALVLDWHQKGTALQFVCRISPAALLVIHGTISDVGGDPPACRFTSRTGDIDLYLDISADDISLVKLEKGIGGPMFALIEEGQPLPIDAPVPPTVH